MSRSGRSRSCRTSRSSSAGSAPASLPVLDGIKDLPSLAKQVIADHNVHILRYGNASLLEQLGTAVFARLVKSSRFDEIA